VVYPEEEPMNVRTIALQLIMAGALAVSLLPSTAAALDSEKQPIYVNIDLTGPVPSLCGTLNGVCTVPAGQRLIIEYVSGFRFIRNTDQTATEVSLLVNDPSSDSVAAAPSTPSSPPEDPQLRALMA